MRQVTSTEGRDSQSSANDALDVLTRLGVKLPLPGASVQPPAHPSGSSTSPPSTQAPENTAKPQDPFSDHAILEAVFAAALLDVSDGWTDDNDKTTDQFENLPGVGFIQDKKDSFLLGYSGSKRSHEQSSNDETVNVQAEPADADLPSAKRTKVTSTETSSANDEGMSGEPSTSAAGRERAGTLVPPKRTQAQSVVSQAAGQSADDDDDPNTQTTPKKEKQTMTTKRGAR